MNNWVLEKLREILQNNEIELSNINDHLIELKSHSLKMVTFLAKFSRQYGVSPKIIDFIQNPCLDILKKSLIDKNSEMK